METKVNKILNQLIVAADQQIQVPSMFVHEGVALPVESGVESKSKLNIKSSLSLAPTKLSDRCITRIKRNYLGWGKFLKELKQMIIDNQLSPQDPAPGECSNDDSSEESDLQLSWPVSTVTNSNGADYIRQSMQLQDVKRQRLLDYVNSFNSTEWFMIENATCSVESTELKLMVSEPTVTVESENSISGFVHSEMKNDTGNVDEIQIGKLVFNADDLSSTLVGGHTFDHITLAQNGEMPISQYVEVLEQLNKENREATDNQIGSNAIDRVSSSSISSILEHKDADVESELYGCNEIRADHYQATVVPELTQPDVVTSSIITQEYHKQFTRGELSSGIEPTEVLPMLEPRTTSSEVVITNHVITESRILYSDNNGSSMLVGGHTFDNIALADNGEMPISQYVELIEQQKEGVGEKINSQTGSKASDEVPSLCFSLETPSSIMVDSNNLPAPTELTTTASAAVEMEPCQQISEISSLTNLQNSTLLIENLILPEPVVNVSTDISPIDTGTSLRSGSGTHIQANDTTVQHMDADVGKNVHDCNEIRIMSPQVCPETTDAIEATSPEISGVRKWKSMPQRRKISFDSTSSPSIPDVKPSSDELVRVVSDNGTDKPSEASPNIAPLTTRSKMVITKELINPVSTPASNLTGSNISGIRKRSSVSLRSLSLKKVRSEPTVKTNELKRHDDVLSPPTPREESYLKEFTRVHPDICTDKPSLSTAPLTTSNNVVGAKESMKTPRGRKRNSMPRRRSSQRKVSFNPTVKTLNSSDNESVVGSLKEEVRSSKRVQLPVTPRFTRKTSITSLAACSSGDAYDILHISDDGNSTFEDIFTQGPKTSRVVPKKSPDATKQNKTFAKTKDQACSVPNDNKEVLTASQETMSDSLKNEIQMIMEHTIKSFQLEGSKTKKAKRKKREKGAYLEAIRQTIKQELHNHFKHFVGRRRYRPPAPQPRRILIKKFVVPKRKPMESVAVQVDGPSTAEIGVNTENPKKPAAKKKSSGTKKPKNDPKPIRKRKQSMEVRHIQPTLSQCFENRQNPVGASEEPLDIPETPCQSTSGKEQEHHELQPVKRGIPTKYGFEGEKTREFPFLKQTKGCYRLSSPDFNTLNTGSISADSIHHHSESFFSCAPDTLAGVDVEQENLFFQKIDMLRLSTESESSLHQIIPNSQKSSDALFHQRSTGNRKIKLRPYPTRPKIRPSSALCKVRKVVHRVASDKYQSQLLEPITIGPFNDPELYPDELLEFIGKRFLKTYKCGIPDLYEKAWHISTRHLHFNMIHGNYDKIDLFDEEEEEDDDYEDEDDFTKYRPPWPFCSSAKRPHSLRPFSPELSPIVYRGSEDDDSGPIILE
ncbi:uncharacterized protein LOC131688461 [Topomyia yanbarensis]|uniref:uncharacterized protein LOC131688461 n=1 Tax=Topomyia yanbarensis TaxID=2498891 RepID=UPI00273A8C1E|nr:uncharacterized protein LOC131688461 [Topomyia yanbarensis]